MCFLCIIAEIDVVLPVLIFLLGGGLIPGWYGVNAPPRFLAQIHMQDEGAYTCASTVYTLYMQKLVYTVIYNTGTVIYAFNLI